MRRNSRWSGYVCAVTMAAAAVATTACVMPTAADYEEALSCKKSDPVGTVRVQPSEVTLAVGASAAITATVIAPDGGTYFFCAPQTFWTSSNSGVARALDGGVLAISPGTAYIAARAGGKADSVLVTVK